MYGNHRADRGVPKFPPKKKELGGVISKESRLLLVSHQHLFRECLVNGLLSRIPMLEIETAETSSQGFARCDADEFVLAIFDADPPDPFSPALTRKFKEKHRATHIVIVGRFRDEEAVIGYLEAGACDFRISDTESLDDFSTAVDNILQGRINHDPDRTRALFARLQRLSTEVSRMRTIDTSVLTDREMEILRLVDEGQSNKQIAKGLHISLHTVKNHVHHILQKTQEATGRPVRNRREAVHVAYNNGWLKMEVN